MSEHGTCPYGPDHRLDGAPVDATEKMMGLGHPFHYGRCSTCGSLVLLDPPADLGDYYPTDYYSFNETPDPGVQKVLAKLLGGLLRIPPLAKAAGRGRFSGSVIPVSAGWFAGLGITQKSKILDVGTGAGFVLARLRWLGFEDLTGIDPYLPVETRRIGPIEIKRQSLGEVQEQYDLVIFHHVLEHVADPVEELRRAAAVLSPGGHILVILPLSDSAAFERYGADWVQLDAPRHATLPTERAMRMGAGEAGLDVIDHWRTSSGFQFWASEQYKLGIPLAGDRSWHTHPENSPWTAAQVKAWDAEARDLNRQGRGDEGAFVMRRR